MSVSLVIIRIALAGEGIQGSSEWLEETHEPVICSVGAQTK